MKFNTFERTVIITCFPPDVFPPVVWSSEISLVKTYFSCLVMPPTEFERRWDAFDFFFSAWPPPVKDVAAADPPKCRQVENISPSFLDPLKRWEVVTVLCELKIQWFAMMKRKRLCADNCQKTLKMNIVKEMIQIHSVFANRNREIITLVLSLFFS